MYKGFVDDWKKDVSCFFMSKQTHSFINSIIYLILMAIKKWKSGRGTATFDEDGTWIWEENDKSALNRWRRDNAVECRQIRSGGKERGRCGVWEKEDSPSNNVTNWTDTSSGCHHLISTTCNINPYHMWFRRQNDSTSTW